MEATIIGTNAITYPILHVWDWRVAIYLFLGGLSGGEHSQKVGDQNHAIVFFFKSKINLLQVDRQIS